MINNIFLTSMFSITFLITFFITWTKLNFNLGPLFIYRLLVTPIWILNIIFLIIFFFLIFIFNEIFSITTDNLLLYIDKDNTNVNVGENATVNINNPNINANVNNMNRVAAAISSTGGATAGIQVAKYVSGPPAIKLVAGIATAGAVQLTTSLMSKVLDSNNNSTKLIPLYLGNDTLNNYPLNLLVDINGLLICAIMFIYIILNILLGKYIISKDLVKNLPNWLQYKLLIYLLDRYLNLWKKSSDFFLIFCFFMLTFCIVICKFGLYIILSY